MNARYERNLTIDWGQCDPAGIVYYPNYFDMFNTSTEAMICKALGVHPRDLARTYDILGVPMADAHNVYHRPSRNGDEIRIISQVTAIGRSSLRISHQLYNAADELAVEGFEVRVWTWEDAEGVLKSRPVPDEVRARLLA